MTDYKIIIILGFLFGYFILWPTVDHMINRNNEDIYVSED